MHLLFRVAIHAKRDVFLHRSVEKLGFLIRKCQYYLWGVWIRKWSNLGDDADVRAKGGGIEGAEVLAVQVDAARGGVVEPHHHVDDRTLSSSTPTCC